MYEIPTIIIGGGVVGLSIAYQLSLRTDEFALFEQNPFLGDHASGRNSGVIHAGLYYDPKSIKLKTCLRGNTLWREWGKKLGIDISSCGKYLVATNSKEIPLLDELFQKAKRNGVQGLRSVSSDELKTLDKVVSCKQAFFAGSSAVLDPSFAVKVLGREIYNKDIPIMKNDRVIDISYRDGSFTVVSEHSKIKCKQLINAAGGFAIGLRKKLGLTGIEDYWVKGSYIKSTQDLYNSSLVYPVPPKDLKGLGVHSSFESDGTLRFGPNSEECSEYSYDLNPNLMKEMIGPICNIFKNIDRAKLSVDYCGIRTKIKIAGKLYPDFWIGTKEQHGIPGYIELLGIESPGFTAAPAIAEIVSDYTKSIK